MRQLVLEMGNPQMGGLVVKAELEDGGEDLGTLVVEMAEVLKGASEAWRDWSIKNETPQERKRRELTEKMMDAQIEDMERQLQARKVAAAMIDGAKG